MKLYVLLIIWLFSFKINAQQVYFNNIYPLNYAVTNATGIVQKGDFYFAAGVGYVNYGTYQKAIIYKIDSSGQLIDTLIYSSLNDRYYTVSPRNINIINDYIFVTYNMNKNDTMLNDTTRSFIMKLDTNLQIIWGRYYNDTLYIPNDPYVSFMINNMATTYDGGQICIVNINGVGNYHRLAIMKTDSLGSAEWIKYLTQYQLSYSIKQTLDSGFVYVSQSTGGTILHKLNQNGNELWTTTILPLVPGQGQPPAHDVDFTNNGDIIVGQNEIYDNDVYKHKIHIWKVSGIDGQIIWDKEYFFRWTVDNIYISQNTAQSLNVLNDGSIVWAGHTLDAGGYGGIMKFNSNGDSLWSRMLQHGGLDSNTFFWGIWDLEPTSDNGFIICGSQKDYASGTGETAWIVKLDSMGCDTPGCETVSIARALRQFSPLEVYPNPATDYINIKIPKQYRHQNNKIIVYDLKAIKVSEIEVPKNKEFIKLNINHFPTGSYYLQFLSNAKFVANGNFIKQ